MRNLAPVYWHEGLFLRPHHLQQQERCQADRLGIQLEFLNRFHHGIAGIEIETGALRNRTIEISRGSLVFPSGEVALIPENAVVSPRTLDGHLPPAGRPIEIFLGLPRIRSNAPNYAGMDSSDGSVSRYRVSNREIRDESTGDNPTTVEFGLANIRVLFGDEDRGAFECIKVAEVLQLGADHFEFSPKFIPPCLRIDAHPALEHMCNRVRDGLLATSRRLQGQKRDRKDTELQIQMLAVNSYVGLVSHLLATGNVHPFHFYGTLAQVFGALSTFAPEMDAADLPPYAHLAPAVPFGQLVQRIETCLEFMGSGARYAEIRLGWAEESKCYVAAIDAEHFAEGNTFYLALSGAQGAQSIRSAVDSGGARIGTPERVEVMRKMYVHGIDTEGQAATPSGLPAREGIVYYMLRAMGPDWEKVKETMKIAVHLPALNDLSVSLFVVRQ